MDKEWEVEASDYKNGRGVRMKRKIQLWEAYLILNNKIAYSTEKVKEAKELVESIKIKTEENRNESSN